MDKNVRLSGPESLHSQVIGLIYTLSYCRVEKNEIMLEHRMAKFYVDPYVELKA